MNRVHLAVLCLIPMASCLGASVVHTPAHALESVLKVNETVLASGSEIVFSWEKCYFCDGYETQLQLNNSLGTRTIEYSLKARVTSLKITKVPPRTEYKLVVKRLSEDRSSSEITGRTSVKAAPQKVENLSGRALSASSVKLDWMLENADGFFLRVYEQTKVVQEKHIQEFTAHSTHSLTIDDLKPDTVYEFQLSAFYRPLTEKSVSKERSVTVRTFPKDLPTLQLRWKFESILELSWINPDWPSPAGHGINCQREGTQLLNVVLSGSSDWVALPLSKMYPVRDITCTVETWYSKERKRLTKVVSEVQIYEDGGNGSLENLKNCSCCARYPVTTAATYEVETIGRAQLLYVVVRMQMDQDRSRRLNLLEYSFCERNATCDSWKTYKTPGPFALLLIKPDRDIKAWTPYTLRYRLHIECFNQNEVSGVELLNIPSLVGAVDPVRNLTAATSGQSTTTNPEANLIDPIGYFWHVYSAGVSWQYDSAADHFLITYCFGEECSSQSVPGEFRTVDLGKLQQDQKCYITIQAVKLSGDRSYLSPPERTSFFVGKVSSFENVTLTFEELDNPATVRLLITCDNKDDTYPVVKYHVTICGTPLPIFQDALLTSTLNLDASCDFIITESSAVDLVRKPWTLYDVSVTVCYGAFDSDKPQNLTLPIFKEKPSDLSGVSWDDEYSLLTWTYKSWNPTGFLVSICPWDSVTPHTCGHIWTGPQDRQYQVNFYDLSGNLFKAFVSAFVKYEGTFYNGSTSSLSFTRSPLLPEE